MRWLQRSRGGHIDARVARRPRGSAALAPATGLGGCHAGRLTLLLVLVLVSEVTGCRPRPTAASPVLVAAAASLSDVVRALADEYQRREGVEVEVTVAASSVLARQIVAGAPADIFISADARQMDVVATANRVRARRDLLGNRLALVAPASGAGRSAPDSAALDARLLGSRRIAICQPAVPAGVYARAYLRRRGLLERLRARFVPLSHVRQVLAAVSAGNVELGFVYATDVKTGGVSVRVVAELPADQVGPIVYPAALGSGDPRARAFFDWLNGPAAARSFAAAGFQVL